MNILLSIVLNRIKSPLFYKEYLKKIQHFFILSASLHEDFKHYYLQGENIENIRKYRIPSEFNEFEKLLGVYEDKPDMLKDTLLLGLWNGMEDHHHIFSVMISLTCHDRDNIALAYKAALNFDFLAADEQEFLKKKEMAEKLVQLAATTLPFKYATFFDRKYIMSYQGMPQIIIGGSLYSYKTDLATVDGFKRSFSDIVEEISPTDEPFDVNNSIHIQKAHAFEKRLLRNPEFQQLLMR